MPQTEQDLPPHLRPVEPSTRPESVPLEDVAPIVPPPPPEPGDQRPPDPFLRRT